MNKIQRKLGLSSCCKPLTLDLFRSYAESGLDYIELSPRIREIPTLPWDMLPIWSEETGVKLWSFHLPFSSPNTCDISLSDEELRIGAVENHKNLIDKATAIGIKLFIIHASSGLPIPDEERPARIDQAKRSLKALADHAETKGATIAVEDLPRHCLGRTSDELLELVEDPRLKICFDTNHILFEDLGDFMKKTVHRYVTTHFADYDLKNERHWMPGEGVTDWIELVSILDEYGYTGPFVYELNFEAPDSIDRPRDLTTADFKENFDDLSALRAPKVLGIPHKDLPHWKDL